MKQYIFISSVQKEFAKETESLYLTKYIERMGTGTGDMIKRCRKAGLREPLFSIPGGFVATVYRKPGVAFETVSKASGQIATQVLEDQVGTKSGPSQAQVEAQADLTSLEMSLLEVCKDAPKKGQELMAASGYASRTGNLKRSLEKLKSIGLIEMTIPGKPTSSKQKYRLTKKGKEHLEGIKAKRERK